MMGELNNYVLTAIVLLDHVPRLNKASSIIIISSLDRCQFTIDHVCTICSKPHWWRYYLYILLSPFTLY